MALVVTNKQKEKTFRGPSLPAGTKVEVDGGTAQAGNESQTT